MGLWFSLPEETKRIKKQEQFNPPVQQEETIIANDLWTNFRYLRNPPPNRVTSLDIEPFRLRG